MIGSFLYTLGCLDSCWLPLGCRWAPFGSLWAALASSRPSFGSLLGPLAALGRHLGPIRVHLAFPWPPFGLPGAPWVPGLTLDFILRANVAQVPRLRTKSSLGEFASWSRGSRLNGVMKCCSDPPSTRAGGQDDVSFTNSLKLGFWDSINGPIRGISK